LGEEQNWNSGELPFPPTPVLNLNAPSSEPNTALGEGEEENHSGTELGSGTVVEIGTN